MVPRCRLPSTGATPSLSHSVDNVIAMHNAEAKFDGLQDQTVRERAKGMEARDQGSNPWRRNGDFHELNLSYVTAVANLTRCGDSGSHEEEVQVDDHPSRCQREMEHGQSPPGGYGRRRVHDLCEGRPHLEYRGAGERGSETEPRGQGLERAEGVQVGDHPSRCQREHGQSPPGGYGRRRVHDLCEGRSHLEYRGAGECGSGTEPRGQGLERAERFGIRERSDLGCCSERREMEEDTEEVIFVQRDKRARSPSPRRRRRRRREEEQRRNNRPKRPWSRPEA